MVKQKKMKEELITPMKSNEQSKSKPTPEQMRIAQILEKKVVDSTIKLKLKQIMDATQRSADEVYVALHDTDFDVNRAVDLLIEGDSLADWCTSEKKKKKLVVELKEKKVEDDAAGAPEQNEEPSKPQRNPSFRGRGDDRRRSGRGVGERAERWPRRSSEEVPSRGRGTGRGRRGQRNPMAGTMVFERSTTYSANSAGLQQPPLTIRNQWEKPLLRAADDEWDMEEYTGSLSQTQIFTSKVKPILSKTEALPEEGKSLGKESAVGLTQPTSVPACLANSPPPVNTSFKPQDVDLPQVTPNRDPPEMRPPQTSHNNSPVETRTEYLYRLSNYPTKQDHSPLNEEKKPSKIPTSAVEMPPEMKPSLSFLDIQFGAMDLGPCESETNSSDTHSSAQSQNASTTTLMPPSSIPSSVSMTHLMGNSISSSASTNNLAASSSMTNVAGNQSVQAQAAKSDSMIQTVNHLMPQNAITSASGMSHLVTPGVPAANMNLVAPNTMSNATLNTMMPNLTSSSAHPMGASNVSSVPTNQNQGRFVQSSQFNHLPYTFMTPPNGSSTTFDRNHEASALPPHMTAPHLPPFKTPPGVPKGAIVANLPSGPLVANQYILNQGNVPYFPHHHPIYYYEDVPPVMNSQQRLPHQISSGYDVSYQPSNNSNRDSVHYNV